MTTSGNITSILLGGTLILGLLGGMAEVSEYRLGDWRRVEDCSQTYWTCVATIGGMPRSGGSQLVSYDRLARSCREFGAWERSVRRAQFDCSMSRHVIAGTCRTVDVECELPGQLY